MSSSVLDASALLALLRQEPGAERVRAAIRGGTAMSAVNLSEVVGKRSESGAAGPAIRGLLGSLGLDVVPFDDELAYRAGRLRPLTREAGLSLGDRACLALAQRLGVPALTVDRSWAGLPLGITVEVLR